MEEGGLQDLENILITADALYPMDFGEAGFTSFQGGVDWVKAFGQFPQIDPVEPVPGWYVGKIHSHHTMGSFHSGTDKGDLYEAAPHLPMYLSLVCNYAMEMDCELAIAMEREEDILTKIRVKLKGMTDFKEEVEEKKVTSNDNRHTFVMKCVPVFLQEGWMITQTRYLANKPKATTYGGTSYGRSYGSPHWQQGQQEGKKEEKEDRDEWYDQIYGPSRGREKEKEGEKKEEGIALKHVPKPGSIEYTIWNRMLESVNELISLGTLDYFMVPAAAIHKLSDDLSVAERLDYMKSLKLYYSKIWFKQVYSKVDGASNMNVLAALEHFFQAHKNVWIVSQCIIPTLNELKTEHDVIRAL